MRRRILFFASVVLGALAACSSSSRPPAGTAPASYQPGGQVGGSGGEGGTGDAAADVGTDAAPGVCNTIPNTGNTVDAVNVQGDPPPYVGGAIQDGTYDITAVSIYVGVAGVAGPAGFTVTGSIQIASGVLQRIESEKNPSTGQTSSANETFRLYAPDAGSQLFIAQTCPFTGASTPSQYTAGATVLTILDPVTKTATTYTKH
jgi:hypothetical protein